MDQLKLIGIAALLLSSPVARAQTNFWSFSNGPFAGSAEYVVTNSSGAIFASDGSHIFRSTDGGSNWTTQVSVSFPDLFDALAINSSDHLFAAGGNGSVYRSTDNGATWPKLQTPGGNLISVLTINKDILYAVSDDSIFASTNEGLSWTTWAPALSNGDEITSFAPFNNGVVAAHLIATTDLLQPFTSDIIFSSDRGATWDSMSASTPNVIEFLAVDGTGTLFGASQSALYRWDISASAWTLVTVPALNGNFVTGLSTFAGKDLLVIYSTANTKSTSSILRSTDDGGTFTPFGPSGASALTGVSAGNTIYCGTWDSGVEHSNDDGTTWSAGVFGFPFNCYAVANGPKNSILAAGTSSAFISNDNGAHWNHLDGLPSTIVYNLNYASTGALYAQLEGTIPMMVSADSGMTWSAAQDSIMSVDNFGALYKGSMSSSAPEARSSDGGTTWTPLNFVNSNEPFYFLLFPTKEGHLFAARGFNDASSSDTLWRSTNFGSTWTDVSPPSSLLGNGFSSFQFGAATSSGTILLFCMPYVNSVELPPVLLRSTDEGTTWQPTTGLSVKEFLSFIIPTSKGIYAIPNSADSSLYQSLDDGKTWQLLVSGLNGVSPQDVLERNDGSLFVATTYGIYRNPPLSDEVKNSGARPADVALRITPDPAAERVTIELEIPNVEGYSFEIMDALGRRVANASRPANEWVLDVSKFSNGIYYCIATDREGKWESRFLVAH